MAGVARGMACAGMERGRTIRGEQALEEGGTGKQRVRAHGRDENGAHAVGTHESEYSPPGKRACGAPEKSHATPSGQKRER